MQIKTHGMRKILEPIEVQVQKLRQLSSDGENNYPDVLLVKSIVFEQLHKLSEKFNGLSKEDFNNYEKMKSTITSLIEQFCSVDTENSQIENLQKRDVEKLAENLLDAFSDVLGTLEKCECLPLKQSLQDSWDYVKDMGAIEVIEDFQNIKELGASIVEVFGPLQKYRKTLVSKLLSENVVLYSSQLCVTLNMLVQLVQEQHHLNAPIYNCKKYVCDRMCWCFKMLIDVLDARSPTPSEENFEKENHFVYRMDLVLDMVNGLQTKTREDQIKECTDLWLGIEDVFSHAMAIAQVCHPYNFSAITGVSQSIIMEYENLKSQLHAEKPDPTMNSLFMNTLNDALYRLEQKVNVSVLTMVMEVFSDPVNALRKLVKMCGNSLSSQERSKSDLHTAIEEFDQVTDKVMQIGKFAIACCKDTQRVLKIRNCLASLESVEPELVPAVTAFYLHPENKEIRAHVKLLTVQWQQEMTKLHNALDLIIDSGAYCQVILDDVQLRVSTMSDSLDNRQGVTQTQVRGVLQRALLLSSQVSATVDDIGADNIDRITIMMIQELKAAIFETGMALKLLNDNATEPQQLRIIKRCELILNVVKRLQPALVTLINNSTAMYTTYRKANMGQGDTIHNTSVAFPGDIYGLPKDEQTFTYVRTPYTVKSNKPTLSIQPANTVPRTMTDLSCLIPYIKRGRTMRSSRSIMYKTPKTSGTTEQDSESQNALETKNLSIVRQHLFSRDNFLSSPDIEMHSETLDLTAILDKVTCLSDTLSSTLSTSCSLKIQNVSSTAQSETKASPDSGQSLLTNLTDTVNIDRSKWNKFMTSEQVDECSSFGGGDAPSAIETLERLEDLQRLDEKIEVLQRQMSAE